VRHGWGGWRGGGEGARAGEQRAREERQRQQRRKREAEGPKRRGGPFSLSLCLCPSLPDAALRREKER